MHYLFEDSDTLNTPVECFVFDAAKERFPIKPHWHYFMEIVYMLSGRAEMFADGRKLLAERGNMVIFHPKSVHSIYAVGDNPPVYAVLKFDINRLNLTPNYAPKLRSIFKSAEKKNAEIFFSFREAEALGAEKTFTSCISEMNAQKYGFDLVIKAEIYKLLTGIIRLWNERGFSVDSEVFTDDDRYDIYNITEYIDINMNSGITVSDIASRCGMSYSYFAKKFLSVYGKTCKEYIETMRIFKVEEFLVFTDFDLNYISQETGFTDCSYMIKCFKKYKGITPKQFRIKHGSKANGE